MIESAKSGVRRVVVADDDENLREVVAEYLSRAGYEVLQAANGLEALLHVKHSAPAAIVLDLRMPRLGGLDALRRIHAFDSSIVVVVVTGESDPEVHRQALVHGARAVLEKPVPLPQLLAALSSAPAIPAAALESRAAPPPPAPERPAPEPRAAAEVLVVDDHPDVRETLEAFLAARGYRVRSATGAGEALRAIADKAPDVVLLDIEMPGLSGSDALPAIRALAPGTAVIMVSGIEDAALARHTLARGAFDYIVKPVDFAYLAQSLESALTAAELGGETA